MTNLLIKYIQKRSPDTQRKAFALLSGRVGILCNLLLCAVKFTIGAVTGALSVTADAVNNLTDAGVNIVTLVGTRLAGKPVDKEHPFGHGRIEYISALVVAFSIFFMSYELARSAVLKILHPQQIEYSLAHLLVLLAAVCVKLWMAYFNRRLYAVTDNLNLKAVMKDSLNDCFATGAAIAALILAGKFHLTRVDGVIGCAVAVFVFFSGVSIVKDILGPLLGEPPSKELTNRIEDIILKNPSVLGVHDLMVHHYGPGSIIASAHAEVPSDMDLMTVHDIIDSAEKEILQKLNVTICIHMDPVATDDSEQENYKILTEIILGEYNSEFTFHDFRLTEENGQKTLSFDLVTPFEYENQKEEIAAALTAVYREKLPEIALHIKIEHPYTA